MKNLTLFFTTVLLLGHGLGAQTVNIPDRIFKAALVGNPAINTNGDGEIQVAEAEAYEGAIDVSGWEIRSLTGIEAFVHIDSLDCEYNYLENLDVSGNPELEYLNCRENYSLENLYVYSNPALTELNCSYCQISSLYLGSNPNLKILKCIDNRIRYLDLSANPALELVFCDENGLRSLNLQNGNNANLLRMIATDNWGLDCIQVDDPSNIPDGWRLGFGGGTYSDSCSTPIVDIPDVNFKAALLGNPLINTNGDEEIQLKEAQSYIGPIIVNGLNIADLTGIEAFIQIDALDCSFNPLGYLSIVSNPALKTLNCASSQLTSLEIGFAPKLEEIHCADNQLANLGLGSAPALKVLNCSNNQLIGLGLLSNPALEVLICRNNQLTTLNVFRSPTLRILHCSHNQLASLFLHLNPALELLNCSNNQLENLNIQNGNNTNTYFNATGNPNLSCILVDDSAWAVANWSQVDDSASFATNCGGAQVVFIPDAIFKAALVNDSMINTNGDLEIQVSEAQLYDGAIDVNNANNNNSDIKDLTGIEAFTAIRYLDCSNNEITSLDVSSISNLEELHCAFNLLTELDVSANPNLDTLNCTSNRLSSLDVSANPALEQLRCSSNDLISLDLSNNTGLKLITCGGNELSSLDVTGNPALDELLCYSNNLTELDVSANPSLVRLDCRNNQLTILDVSANASLVGLICNRNELMSLDLSANPVLSSLDCRQNQLTTLNIQNGNNTNLYFEINSNPNLACIQVDDPDWARMYWSGFPIGPIASFSADCEGVVHIPDPNFKAALAGTSAININGDGEIQVFEAERYDGPIEVAGRNIDSLTGLEAFISIVSLNCSENRIQILNIGTAAALKYLDCSGNELDSLDVGSNPALEILNCYNNQLSTLDLSENPALESLDCSSNQLQSLNIKNGSNIYIWNFDARQNPNLGCIQVDDPAWSAFNWGSGIDSPTIFSSDCNAQVVHIPDPNFKAALVGAPAVNTNGDEEIQVWEALFYESAIDVSGLDINNLTGIEAFTEIDSLDCSDNQIVQLNMSSIPGLKYLNCSRNQLTSLGLNGCQSLAYLNGSHNLLTSLDVSSNVSLRWLEIGDNRLTSLNLSTNALLNYLSCWNNELTSLDLSSNRVLHDVYCQDNQLQNLATESYYLEHLHCSGNQLASLDVSPNAGLKQLYCSNNQLESLDVSANLSLRALDCSTNLLTGLDAAANFRLEQLNCSANQLASLSLGMNTALETLNCGDNQLASLDVSANVYLTVLDCSANQLEALDVADNPVLLFLDGSNNRLSELDVSANSNLYALYVSDNSLRALNLQNGNNTNIEDFTARNNPELACIQVDAPAWAAAHWSDNVDPTATFSADCEATTGTAAPLEKASLSVYPNPTTGELTLALGAAYPEVTVEVRDMMGRTLSRKTYSTTDQLGLTLDGPAGLYFVTVRAGDEEFITVRVVKY